MIRLQPYVAAALVRHYGLRRSALSSGLFEDMQDPAYAAQIGAWHESLPADHRLSTEQLATLAAPDLLADVRILHGLDSLTHFLVLARCGANGHSCLLAGPQKDGELELKPASGPDAVSDMILLMLAASGDPSEPEMNVRLTHAELAALLAWIDLDHRAAFVARIAHEPRPESFTAEALAEYCQKEAGVPDPRWLLPFFAPLLGASIPATAQQAASALQALARRGLAEPRGAGFAWTLPGQFLSESFQRRFVLAAIDTAAAGPNGALGRHSACLLRSDQPLWFIDIPPDGEAALAGINILDARKILDTLFTPVAAAPELRKPQPPPAPAYAAAPPPGYATAPPAYPPAQPYAAHPSYAAPATPRPAPSSPPPVPGFAPQPAPYTAPRAAPQHPAQPQYPPQAPQAQNVCRNCRQPLPAGAVFCGLCGTRQS